MKTFFLIILVIIPLTDLLVFSGISHLFRLSGKAEVKKKTKRIFWFITLSFVVLISVYFIIIRGFMSADHIIYRHNFVYRSIVFVIYFPKFIFGLFYSFEILIRLAGRFLLKKQNKESAAKKIWRFRIISITGIFVFLFLLYNLIYGMLVTRTDFRIERISITFKNLPESFDGIKIAQVSDMHSGSFYDISEVRKGIDLLVSEKPDMICITGDLINNTAVEAKNMLQELKRIKAPLGVFSILGNHDVGDYRRWETIEEITGDFRMLKNVEEQAGWKLLINENALVYKGADSIAVAGVNTWGRSPFKKYGKLDKALEGIENVDFIILLTHNPDHWDDKVDGKSKCNLTLAGHTHGMQFGIDCCGILWSPVSWFYRHGSGLYNDGTQYLYVNRGFGYLGFSGRIGMPPEITIIQLKRGDDCAKKE